MGGRETLLGCSVARQGPAPLAESHRLLRLSWELCPVVECLSEPRDLASPVEEGKMREGRLSEALRAVEKPPGTAPSRLTEDGRAVREAQAEATSQSSPRLFPAPIPGRGAAKCRAALQLAGRRGRGPPGDASLWNPGRVEASCLRSGLEPLRPGRQPRSASHCLTSKSPNHVIQSSKCFQNLYHILRNENLIPSALIIHFSPTV